MLDDDDRILGVAEFLEGVDEAAIVALMEADAWLVEDVEDVDEFGSELGCEAYALAFSAGEGGGVAVEGEVAETDAYKEGESASDLFEDFVADGEAARVKARLDGLGPLKEVGYVEARELGDVFAVDEEVKGFAVEAVAVAFGAGLAGVELAAPFLSFGGGVVGLLHLDVFYQTFVGEEIVGDGVGLGLDLQALGSAVEDVVESLFGEIADGGLEVAAVFFADGGDLPEDHGVFVFAEGDDAAVEDREGVVGDDFGDVDDVDGAETFAAGAGAERGVEGEIVGGRLAVG